MDTMPIDPTAFRPMKVTATRDTQIGFELESLNRKITLDKSRLYQEYQPWPRFKNLHTDYEAAQDWGLRKPVIAGCQLSEYAGELLIKFFGKGYMGGRLSVKFIGVVEPDDEITTKGVVTEKIVEDTKIRLVLDIWGENQRGEKVVVGTASGLVD